MQLLNKCQEKTATCSCPWTFFQKTPTCKPCDFSSNLTPRSPLFLVWLCVRGPGAYGADPWSLGCPTQLSHTQNPCQPGAFPLPRLSRKVETSWIEIFPSTRRTPTTLRQHPEMPRWCEGLGSLYVLASAFSSHPLFLYEHEGQSKTNF